MIRAIALDDERPALEILEVFCSQLDTLVLLKTFTRAREARDYLEEHTMDLMFLDINMPAESGIDFFKSISHKSMVIFTTAYSEYAVESYELKAVDYLLKPFTFDRFAQAVQKAVDFSKFLHQSGNPTEKYLYFRVDYSLVPVAIEDILFIEGLDNYLKIHRHNQRPLVVRLTIKAMLEKLPSIGFERVHRSFVVALNKIQAVRNKMILIGEEEIPLGNSYEEGFYKSFLPK